MGIQRVPNLLRWTVLACCLPYPGDPKSAIDCFFLFGISLHPGVTGSAPHWKFRGCRVHSFPSPQELLRPASWLALLSRTFTFELAPTRSPSISVEYDYVDKQSIPTAGLSPASPTALWAAGHRISPAMNRLTPIGKTEPVAIVWREPPRESRSLSRSPGSTQNRLLLCLVRRKRAAIPDLLCRFDREECSGG